MKKKKILLFFILFLSFTISIFNAVAHPGRTDENGGHWNRKTGEYHFHTGEYAGRESSGSSSTSEYESFEPPYELPTENPYKKNTNKTTNKSSDTSAEASSNSSSSSPSSTTKSDPNTKSLNDCIYCGLIKKHLPKYKIEEFSNKLNSLLWHCSELHDLSEELRVLKPTVQIPNAYEIGKDGLPKDKNCISRWGDSFTVYKSFNGKKLHTEFNCCYARTVMHIYCCHIPRNISEPFCKMCSYGRKIPDMTWYKTYLKYKRIENKHRELVSDCNRLHKETTLLYKKCNSTPTRILITFSKKSKNLLKETNDEYIRAEKEYKILYRKD